MISFFVAVSLCLMSLLLTSFWCPFLGCHPQPPSIHLSPGRRFVGATRERPYCPFGRWLDVLQVRPVLARGRLFRSEFFVTTATQDTTLYSVLSAHKKMKYDAVP